MQQRFAMLPRAKIAFRTVVPFQLRITVVRRAVHQTSESNPCVDEATPVL
jgi:hypothetical protein